MTHFNVHDLQPLTPLIVRTRTLTHINRCKSDKNIIERVSALLKKYDGMGVAGSAVSFAHEIGRELLKSDIFSGVGITPADEVYLYLWGGRTNRRMEEKLSILFGHSSAHNRTYFRLDHFDHALWEKTCGYEELNQSIADAEKALPNLERNITNYNIALTQMMQAIEALRGLSI